MNLLAHAGALVRWAEETFGPPRKLDPELKAVEALTKSEKFEALVGWLGRYDEPYTSTVGSHPHGGIMVASARKAEIGEGMHAIIVSGRGLRAVETTLDRYLVEGLPGGSFEDDCHYACRSIALTSADEIRAAGIEPALLLERLQYIADEYHRLLDIEPGILSAEEGRANAYMRDLSEGARPHAVQVD
jgi:hypothetical protein